MPQVFQVLRCFKCLVFQVHQTKKSNKWQCKLCGEKQSVKRHYGIGTAKECRIHVQKLNGIRGEIDEINMQTKQESDEENEPEVLQYNTSLSNLGNDSKWSSYVEQPDPIQEPDSEPLYLGDAEVVLEIPKKRRKQFKNISKSNNYTKAPTVGDTMSQKTQINININKKAKFSDHMPQTVISSNNQEVQNISTQKTLQEMVNENLNSEIGSSKLNAPSKKFVPPVINKNSKWAQFAQDEESDDVPSPGLTDASQNNLMFSLCEDSDLDIVLDL